MIEKEFIPYTDSNLLLTDLRNDSLKGFWFTADLVHNRSLDIGRRLITMSEYTRYVSWRRTHKFEECAAEEKEDYIIFHQPMKKDDEDMYKRGCMRVIIGPGILSGGFWFSTNRFTEHINSNSEASQLVVRRLLKGPYDALINVLQNHTDKDVGYTGDDVSINGKKIIGAVEYFNDTGAYQVLNLTYNYDKNVFRKMYGEKFFDNFVEGTLTGVNNEIPELSKKQLTTEWYDELENLLIEVKDYV